MVWFLRDESDGAVALNPATAAPLATVSLMSATLTPSTSATAADTPDASESAPAGINAGSHAGLSEVMTYTRDLVDGRSEYTGNQLVDAVLFGPRWTVTNITFSFPATAEFYETPYYQPGHLANHIPFNAAQQTAPRYAFSLLASYTGLTFTEVTESADTHGIIRMSQTNDDATLPSAEGNFPGSDASDGDIWFGDNNQPFYLTPAIGNWGQATMMHEIGHTMGLKHGHQDYTGLDLTNGGYLDGPGPHYGTAALPANRDGWAWSLMTYRSAPGYTANFQGDRYNQPQTYMQADIAALQFMYGANFTTNATDSVYTFSATTGEMFINGVGQGTPEINAATGIGKIFRTLWDGNGIDTYNLANFGDNQTIDLRPGQFSTFSQAQLGDSRPLTAGFTAQPGNIANALLYQGDVRSLIENAIAGSGNDILIGNQAANALTGNDGNDVLDGGAGDDVLTGGKGNDIYHIDSAGDKVTELHLEGYDVLYTPVSYSLFGRAVEMVVMTGTDDISVAGNSLANLMLGNNGDNTLDGADGNDTLIGEAGNDSYTVDSAGDVVTEAAGEGTDLVLSQVTYTLGAEIENLTMIGSIDWGQSGNGNALNNVITGNLNSNILDGRAGADTLVGGDGHDSYYIDSTGDKVIEANGEGTDEINSSVSYSLSGTYVELLRLTGSADLTATGYSMGNYMVGNSGNNVMNGKGGSDYLYGGAGSDVFVFDSVNGHETIADFTASHNDTINLNGWTGGVANIGAVTQSGTEVLITVSDWNDITVVDAVVAEVLAHIVW